MHVLESLQHKYSLPEEDLLLGAVLRLNRHFEQLYLAHLPSP